MNITGKRYRTLIIVEFKTLVDFCIIEYLKGYKLAF